MQLLLAQVGHDARRWARLFASADRLPVDLEDQALAALEAGREQVLDPDASLWSALRRRLSSLGSDGDTRRARVEALYEAFEPAHPVTRMAWLFAPAPDLPDAIGLDDEKKKARLAELRLEAVLELWERADHWALLADLVRAVEAPARLGGTLAHAPFAAELEQRLFEVPHEEPYARILPRFAAERARAGALSSAMALRALEAMQRCLDAASADEARRMAQDLAREDVEALFAVIERDETMERSRLVGLVLSLLPFLRESTLLSRYLGAPEPVSATVAESVTESVSATESESVTESVTESESESVSESASESVSASESESESASVTASVAVAVAEAEAVAEAVAVAEAEAVTEPALSEARVAPGLELAPRLNLITGDNSLGKTLTLDALFVTSRVAVAPPEEPRTKSGKPSRAKKKTAPQGPPPSLVVYARENGRFSVWDSLCNTTPVSLSERDILHGQAGAVARCQGFLGDAVRWRSERREAYALLEKALAEISPRNEPLKLGRPARLGDRDVPTLVLAHDTISAANTSSAVRRILGLAYVLVWSISEMRRVSPEPIARVTLLVDEIEAHLHPRWQRSILPDLLDMVVMLAPSAQVQLVVTTHAPLVLASVEQRFDPEMDALFGFRLAKVAGGKKKVKAEKKSFTLHGDASGWLGSDVFGTAPRSIEAEEVIEKAVKGLENPKLDKRRGRALDKALREVLSESDPFWVRWGTVAEKKGWTA